VAVQTKKKSNPFKSIRMELKKVSWPNRKEVGQYTAVVFAMCVAVGAMIAVCDTVFSFLFRSIVG
jgi:preprotein translocase subunit SecE